MATNTSAEGAERRHGPGRPPKLTAQDLDRLRLLALSRPTDSLAELTARFIAEFGAEVCSATVRKGLRAAGVARQRPERSSRQRPPTPDPSTAAKRYGYTVAHRGHPDPERYPSSLTDAEWELVADLFESPGQRGRPPRYSRRAMLDACCYVVRSGCSWRMLPKEFPPWDDVYKSFRRWTAANRFEIMHDRLRAMWRQRAEREVAPTAAVIDSQSVKTTAQGGPKGFDAGKKVKGRKRHLLVDTLGLVLAVLIQPACVQDRDGAAPVIERALQKYPSVKKLYADGGYAGQCARDARARWGLDVEVVRRPANRSTGRWCDGQLPLLPEPTGFVVLPKRWVVERTNAWNDRPRRLNKDHDRRLDVAAAWIWLTEARILVRRLVGG